MTGKMINVEQYDGNSKEYIPIKAFVVGANFRIKINGKIVYETNDKRIENVK